VSAVVFAYHDVGCRGLRVLHKLGIEIAAVYTHADDPAENTWFGSVGATCAELGIPVRVGADPNSPAEMQAIRALKPLAFFSFYFRDLLKDELLAIPARGGVNLHGSLLPRYRGRAPVNWQILHGEREGGVTLHYMVKRADAGDIVDQEAFPIGLDDTPTGVYARLLPAAERVLERSAIAVMEGTAPRVKQLESKATKFGRRRPEDGLIDWRQSAEDVRNLVRAVTKPYPGAFTFAGSERVLVWWAQHDARGGSGASDASTTERMRSPGRSLDAGRVSCNSSGVFVACGDRRRLRLAKVEIGGIEGDALAFQRILRDGVVLSSSPSGAT
jgi:UDP-4-amino-4-deoxy-L-arabinose formyltransferase/UDP-glucuronic acid dehydrogenase (UDP-4-keto-hexauronic acid decarboxylating)